MPRVQVDLIIEADVDVVWKTVCDVESYPRCMDNVRSVRVLGQDGDGRTTAWSVLLKGSILEWSESERIDDVRRRLEFTQIDGDLDVFTGYWAVVEEGPARTRVTLDIEFEIGIPLLAPMLDPVAERALRDNSVQMLLGLESRAVQA